MRNLGTKLQFLNPPPLDKVYSKKIPVCPEIGDKVIKSPILFNGKVMAYVSPGTPGINPILKVGFK